MNSETAMLAGKWRLVQGRHGSRNGKVSGTMLAEVKSRLSSEFLTLLCVLCYSLTVGDQVENDGWLVSC